MKTWVKVLIGIAIALVVLLVVAYFGMGYVIYAKLGNVKGSCDEHLANRPDNFALHPEWPAGFDVTPYFMTGYEAVKFPSRDPASRSPAGGSRQVRPIPPRRPSSWWMAWAAARTP